MAPLIENNYVGDGTTVSYSFTFPYLEEADVRVSLDGLATTQYILANATTIQFNTAPANGVAIRIYRVTAQDDLAAVFYPGSAIRAQDLNDNFTQNLFVTQESSFNADVATAAAAAAEAAASQAQIDAAQAAIDAATAQADATTAQNAASTAQASVSVAQNAATSAQNSATAAQNQATQAATDAATAVATAAAVDGKADTAIATANSAETKADNAVATANTAEATANAARDAVASGPVVSVNTKTGTVVLDLADINNVSSSAPADGQVLAWDVSNNHWVPTDVPSSIPTGSWSGIAEAS